MELIKFIRVSGFVSVALCLAFFFGFEGTIHAGIEKISQVEASQNHYVFPENISLSLMNFGKAISKGSLNLKGIMEAKVGTLQKLEVFFESSPDLEINPTREKLESLGEKKKKEFVISVKPGKGKADEMGSSVKMRVKYLPYYAKCREVVKNPAEFPIEIERRRLIEIVERNLKSSSIQQDAIRFFLK